MNTKTEPGKMYGRRRTDGRLEEVDRTAHVPDVVICRRVTDYAPAPLPRTALTTPCTHCGARVAYNPAGPHQDVPKICMQCAHIRPEPIEGTS